MTTKTAFVAGGTGGIGEGVVKMLLFAGYEVFVPVRAVDKSERLLAYVQGAGPGSLRIVSGDLGDIESVAACRRKMLESASRIDLVVVAAGSSFYGHSLHKIPVNEWNRLIVENLATHFHLIREFLGYLHEQNQGTFVTLTGPEADFVQPDNGLMSVIAAAQKMMARVAAQEASGTAVRVYAVTSKTPVATRSREGQSEESWVSAEDIGKYVWALAEGKLPHADQPLHMLESKKQVEKALARHA